MMAERKSKGQKELQDRVVKSGLCTGCGACVGLCPYQASYEDRTVFLDKCELNEGKCYAYCPRTPTDIDSMKKALFEKEDIIPEVGAVKGFYIARAKDPKIRETAQHGGTVTALVRLALKEGIIEEAVLTENDQDLLPGGKNIRDPDTVSGLGKSRFVVSPVLAIFNRLAAADIERGKIGIVATPCQALALSKMRLYSNEGSRGAIDRLRLVIGLFCGWALSWEKLRTLLSSKMDIKEILGMDIPPSRYHSMEVYTPSGTIEISLDEVTSCVREGCWSCFDMTAEFSDISVGSARLPEGWEEAKHWNQVIVRTRAGENLVKLAKDKGILEFREASEGNLKKLKEASVNKKRAAVKNLVKRSGKEDDLIYLDCRDPSFRGL
jgi:coenzyme F420 hydrogenase subunit beta